MKQWIRALAVVGVLAVLFTAHTLAAQEAATTFETQGDQTQVTITLQKDAMAQGVSALSANFLVQATVGELGEDDVTFQFSSDLPGSVQRYVYDAHTGLLSVYVAGANGALFDGTQATLGSIQIHGEQQVQAQVSFGQEGTQPLTLLTGTSTQSTPSVQLTQTTLTTGETTPGPGTSPAPEVSSAPGTSPAPEASSAPGTSPAPAPSSLPQTSPAPETSAAPGVTSAPEHTSTPSTTSAPEHTSQGTQAPLDTQTGDHNNLMLPIAVLVVCAIVLVAVALIWYQRRSRR